MSALTRVLTFLLKMGKLERSNMSMDSYLVKRHPVELDRFGVLPELEVDVAHVHLQPAGVVEHPILRDHLKTFSFIDYLKLFDPMI